MEMCDIYLSRLVPCNVPSSVEVIMLFKDIVYFQITDDNLVI